MKIAVVGAGAMGSLFGAMLAEAGNEVWLYDVWVEHVKTINQDGLTIERAEKTRTLSINATTAPEQIGPAELVIIFVKSTHTASAAETARRLAGSDGAVLTLQNGMGNADILSELIDPERVLAGTTSHGATLLGPGSIRHAGSVQRPSAPGPKPNRAERLHANYPISSQGWGSNRKLLMMCAVCSGINC